MAHVVQSSFFYCRKLPTDVFRKRQCFSRTGYLLSDYYRHHSIVWNHTVQQSSKTTSIIYKENSGMDQPIIEVNNLTKVYRLGALGARSFAEETKAIFF